MNCHAYPQRDISSTSIPINNTSTIHCKSKLCCSSFPLPSSFFRSISRYRRHIPTRTCLQSWPTVCCPLKIKNTSRHQNGHTKWTVSKKHCLSRITSATFNCNSITINQLLPAFLSTFIVDTFPFLFIIFLDIYPNSQTPFPLTRSFIS